jgi:hypothetical protein
MAQVIQLRRDTKVNWENNNPVLAAGEIAVQTDTYQIKIGDGQKAWSDLPFVSYGLLDNPEDYLNNMGITTIIYNDSNLPSEIDFENGSKALYTYDGNLLSKVDYTEADGTTVFYSITYTYDTNNLLISVTRSYK